MSEVRRGGDHLGGKWGKNKRAKGGWGVEGENFGMLLLLLWRGKREGGVKHA